jgi:HEPN domain-containing protein
MLKNMKNSVNNWVVSALYDLETARHMFRAKRYIYTIFMCHLALEKILKAKVESVTNKTSPKTHDLEYLSSLAGISFDEESGKFLAELSNLSIVTRYPADFEQMLQDFSGRRAQAVLKKSSELLKWIRKSSAL